jgi:hypothetical protein
MFTFVSLKTSRRNLWFVLNFNADFFRDSSPVFMPYADVAEKHGAWSQRPVFKGDLRRQKL